jgi:prevent-host-death family protein
MKINIRKAREKFSEIVNTVAIKGERVILLSNKKPKAAIVSLKDLEMLERRGMKKRRRLAQIEKVRKLRNIIRKEGRTGNSNITLQRIREDRIEKLSGLD